MTSKPSGGTADPSDRARLDLLLADYQAAREDERSFASTMAAGISVGAALLALLAAAVSQTQVCAAGQDANCVPGVIMAMAPLGPAALGAFLATFGAASVVRSYYMRALEVELRGYATAPFPGYGPIGPMSYISLITEVTSLRRGRHSHRLLTNFILVVVLVVFGGLALYIGAQVSPAVRVLMAATYVPFALLLFGEVTSITLGGPGLFGKAARRLAAAGGTRPRLQLDVPEPDERSLTSYLLWPRPEDWVKWLVAPGVYLVAAASSGSFNRVTDFTIVWLILEFLLYQARYQWNDLRGMAEDRQHVERRARARLPEGVNQAEAWRNVAASAAVAGLRIGAALAAGWLFGMPWSVLLLAVLVFGVAAVYEWLRLVGFDRLGSDAVALLERPRTPLSVIMMWLVVGLGYAVRAGVGLALAGVSLAGWTGLAGLLCFAAFGVMFVLLTWALEAASHCRAEDAKDEKSTWHATAELAAKPHVAALLRYTYRTPKEPQPALGEDKNCGAVAILEDRGRRSAPWNLALTVAVGAGEALGMGLAGGATALLTAMTVTIDLAGAALLIEAPSTLARAGTVAVGAVAIVGASAAIEVDWPLVAAAPWLVITILYVAFRASSYTNLKHAMANTAAELAKVTMATLKWIVGRRTLEYLSQRRLPITS